MNKRVLLAGVGNAGLLDIQKGLEENFETFESQDVGDTIEILTVQYRMIHVILISMELLYKDNYHVVEEIQNNELLKHISVICICSSADNEVALNQAHHDALDHGVLIFYTAPFDIPAMIKQVKTLMKLKDQDESLNFEDDLINQMQVIMKNLNCGITVAYDDFGIPQYEYTNDLYYTIFGYTRDEFEGEEIFDLRDLVLPEYFFEVKTALNTARTQMRPVVMIFRARKKTGDVIWVKARCSVHYMKTKGKTAFITTYEDITNMKALENRTQAINERLAGSEVYIQLDVTNRIVEEYHSQYEPENDLIPLQNRNYQDLLLTKIYEKEDIWEQLSYEKLLQNYYSGNMKLTVEYRRYLPDGSIRWFETTAIIIRGRDEDTVNAFIYAHDVDTMMKTRIAKDTITDSDVSDITIINIASGMCRNVKLYESNVITDRDISHKYEGILSLFIEMEVAPEDREACQEFLKLPNLIRAVKEKGTASISFWITTRNGMNVRKNGTVTYLDSTHEDLLLVGRDITELFEKEKEQQTLLEHAAKLAEIANQAKSDFLSRMSHDMRTPLNSILGLTKIAKEENDMNQLKKHIEDIDVSGQYLLSLINDTLDLSKIESGKMEFHRESFPLSDFIHEIDTVIKPLMDAKNIEFIMKLEQQTNNIAVDRTRFMQIFFNLLSNAAKYTPEGGRVELTSEPIPAKGEKTGMRFHIRDNGIGMSKEFQKVLFEPFSQEYRPVHAEQKGTGLGLAIVKQIIDLMEGNIQVMSEPEKGTEFILDLYAYKLEELKNVPKPPQYNLDRLHGLQVLLVDDTEVNSMIVQRMLKLKGCKVDAAYNGLDGFTLFEQSEIGYYDIILTDLRMPVMDGFEEAKRIRALDRPDAKTIPIIAATADAYQDIKNKIQEAGMNERLVKPIGIELLGKTMLRLIDAQRSTAS